MTATIAVTGADGFVGRHFVTHAVDQGVRIVRVLREPAQTALSGVSDVVADLSAGWPDVGDVDAVLHLAGLAAVGPSFDEPQHYIEVNSAMVTHMAESLLRVPHKPRLVAVSTGAIYQASRAPIDEAAAVAFTSPYVVSKMLVENLVSYYTARGLDGVCIRPFNHIGPGQHPGFLVPDLAQRLNALVDGDSMVAGDLSTARDYTDVRDVVAAYLRVCLAPTVAHRTYNVASGVARTGVEVLSEICAAMGRPVPQISSATDANRRPVDNPVVVGDSTRLSNELGWRPVIPFAQSIRDFVAAQTPGGTA